MSNWSQACRLCMCSDMESANFTDRIDGFDINIGQMLEACTSIDVEPEENLPNLVCKTCLEDLVNVYQSCAKLRENYDTVTRIFRDEYKKLVELKEEIYMDYTDENVVETIVESDASHESLDGATKEEFPVLDDIIEEVYEKECLDDSIANVGYVLVDRDAEVQIEEVVATIYPKCEEVTEVDSMSVMDQELNNVASNMSADLEDKTEQKEFTFQCDDCGASFFVLHNLNQHILKNHPCELITCEICHQVFSKKSIHDVHFATTHSNALHNGGNRADEEGLQKGDSASIKSRKKIHNCPYCDKLMVSNSALLTHIRIHTDEKPFKCQICFSAFRTQGGLDLHLRRHNGIRPFQCDQCTKSFSESSNLKVHMRQHTGEKPHQCLICKKRFSRVYLLQLHLRIHTGVKPYQCSFCEKAFRQQGDFLAHTRIHTGERPYKCEICLKGFVKSSALTSHKKRHRVLL